jgi:hypothetical protein
VSLDHEEIRDLLAVHALDALDEDERHEVEGHLAACESCRSELDGHRSVAALIGAQALEIDVPASLWERVRSGIAPAPAVPIRPRRLPLIIASGAAAAMLVLVTVQTARLASMQSELLAAEEGLASAEAAISAGDWSRAAAIASSDPAARSVALEGTGTATITLLPDGTGFITTSDLVDLPAGRAYQLWIVQRGEVVSAGLLRSGEIGSVFRFDPETLEGLVVTEEEAAGVVVAEGPAVAAWFDA